MKNPVYVIDLGNYLPKKAKVENEADRVPFVVGKIADHDLANSFAQTYSYVRHGNAIYGLFGIFIGDGTEIERVARSLDSGTMHKIFAATASF